MAPMAAFLACLSICAAADLPRDVLDLSRIRLKMRQALDTLPNYTCLAVTERSRQALRARAPRHIDTVRVEVAHADNQDMLAWPGAAGFESADPAQVIGSGMFSSGEFFAHLAGIFNQNAVLRYAGIQDVLGRKLMRWDFELAPMIASEWRITCSGRSVIAGEIGSFWADPETHEVLRVEVRAQGIPPTFPIIGVESVIDYARVRIGDRDVYLPQTARTVTTEYELSKSINLTEFSHCREYLTNSAIRYGADAPSESTQPAPAQGVREFVLPGGLKVTIELAGDVDSHAAVGDEIRAVVAANVEQKKRVVIPKGAIVSGRIRQMELESETNFDAYLMGLEFTDVEFPGHHARFFGRLLHAPGRNTRPSTIPGVAVMVVDAAPFRLDKGMSMVWITEDISRK